MNVIDKCYFKFLLKFIILLERVFHRISDFLLILSFDAKIFWTIKHCVKIVHIRSCSGPYFPTFWPNMDEKIPNTDTFHEFRYFYPKNHQLYPQRTISESPKIKTVINSWYTNRYHQYCWHRMFSIPFLVCAFFMTC